MIMKAWFWVDGQTEYGEIDEIKIGENHLYTDEIYKNKNALFHNNIFHYNLIDMNIYAEYGIPCYETEIECIKSVYQKALSSDIKRVSIFGKQCRNSTEGRILLETLRNLQSIIITEKRLKKLEKLLK